MPKAFRDHIRTIQRNAIHSWTLLSPRPEIILFGNDAGTQEIAEEFGARHIPNVVVNEHGTPLLNDLFQQAEREAHSDVLCYVNADILLMSHFGAAVQQAAREVSRFLFVSKRVNLDITEPIAFEPGWEASALERAGKTGVSGDHTSIDVFVFCRGLYPSIPDFGLGRLWFDQWLIKSALQTGAPVVDLSKVAPVIHQNHDYNHVPGGAAQVWRGQEAEHNFRLYGGKRHAFTLLDVTHELLPDGRLRRVRLRKQKFEMQHLAWDLLVRRTKGLRNMLKLRRRFWRQPAVTRSGRS